MSPISRAVLLTLVLGATSAACAGSRLEPTLVSSAEGTSYALRYPEAVERAASALAQHEQRATELTSALSSRPLTAKDESEASLLTRVIDDADRSGKSYSFVAAQAQDEALRAFWEEERGAVGGRVQSAVQKQAELAHCTELDSQGAVQHALREAIERQRERRLRSENEGQRTLEQHKARLAPELLQAMQRTADDVARASQLVNVTLVEDHRELERLLDERRSVESTLERAVDDERAIQTEPRRKSEQKASQERVIQIEKSRALIPASVERGQQQLKGDEERLTSAREAYQRALASLKQKLERDSVPSQEAGE